MTAVTLAIAQGGRSQGTTRVPCRGWLVVPMLRKTHGTIPIAREVYVHLAGPTTTSKKMRQATKLQRCRKTRKAFQPVRCSLVFGLHLFWAISCFWGAAVEAQQDQTCSRDDADAYMECVRDNPCLCSNCDPNPLDETPEIIVDTPPQDCRDVNRIFCPLIRCCSACEDAARSWYECTFQSFSVQTLGEECSTTCNGYAYADVDGDCQPTSTPEPSAASAASSAPSDIPSQSPDSTSSGFIPTASPYQSGTQAPVSSSSVARSGDLALALCAALALVRAQ
jgi:hypothetical protein